MNAKLQFNLTVEPTCVFVDGPGNGDGWDGLYRVCFGNSENKRILENTRCVWYFTKDEYGLLGDFSHRVKEKYYLDKVIWGAVSPDWV